MARKVAVSTLNASTIDILNVIRRNASLEYQSKVPSISDPTQIPKVGEALYGYPALANEFINALINRIAAVRVKSATFNNPYADLKKGYLEFGETVEEVFVNIAKAREFSAEKAASREFKRTLPDVRAAFHVMNFKSQYPITIQDMDLRQAFLNESGVQDMIARIVDSVYLGAEYDEFLIFKYLLIKGITSGQMKPISIGSGSNLTDAAKAFRGSSNKIQFISTDYNASGVHTATPREDQEIFMDAEFNAAFDVDVLASAFNMEKADFMGRLRLIDDWTTFDNERFAELVSDGQAETVTDAELALMANVKAVLIDREWFQVYDNLSRMTEKYVAGGLYWNYFYNVWKSVSISPFSNAIVFVTNSATITAPSSFKVKVASKDVSADAVTFGLAVDDSTPTVQDMNVSFKQTEKATEDGVAVLREGGIMFDPTKFNGSVALMAGIGSVDYVGGTNLTANTAVGTEITMNKSV